MSIATPPALRPTRAPWNKGRLIGQQHPLLPKHVWSIRVRLEMADNKCDLALFNMAFDRTNAALAAGGDELIPSDYANRLLGGESPVRVYRDLRGMTQAALAENAGVGRVLAAEIETGRKHGSVATLRALADALGVSMDDLTA